MSNLPLIITIRKLCKPHDDDDCDDDDHDLPPVPPPTLQSHSLSPIKVLLICTLAATFSFLCYIIIVKTCRAFQTRRRRRSRSYLATNEDFIHEDHENEPVVFHPVWLINTIGLDQSVIDSIEMFKYRKEDGLIDSDCPVCLGVFEEEETLRILPKCSHAFHVSCIDTWLRSHKNCPLCRAPVVNNAAINQTDQNSVELSALEEFPSGGPENWTTRVENTHTNGIRVQSDLTNHCCQKLEPMRRSVSMGSFHFVHQELVVSDLVQKSTERRGSSSRTVKDGRAHCSGGLEEN